MDESQDSKEHHPVYPTPTKGPVSDDHSNYATQKHYAGEDLDKSMRRAFIAIVVIFGLLFMYAVAAWTGKFMFRL
jgi:hypothetical protein